MDRVADKVAIVTGAASGIGQVTAQLLAREGARVVVADLDEDGAQAVAEGIRADGGEALAQRVDVGDEAAVHAMVARAVEAYGAVHILHNNAALTAPGQHALDTGITGMDVATWERSMTVNLRGAMLGCKHAIPAMLAAGGGAIVNMSSNQSLSGDLTQPAYAASKAGVNQLTRTVATQYGRDGIRCNAICPGLIRTGGSEAAVSPEIFAMIEAHNLVPRTGRPEDIAWTVLFLASDEAAFITGQVLSVDGGQLAHLPHYADLLRTTSTTTR